MTNESMSQNLCQKLWKKRIFWLTIFFIKIQSKKIIIIKLPWRNSTLKSKLIPTTKTVKDISKKKRVKKCEKKVQLQEKQETLHSHYLLSGGFGKYCFSIEHQ